MTRLFLIRHGETTWNAEGRYQGQSREDPPLSAWGLRQAQALAECLASESLDAIYASDLRRACQTAEIVAAAHGLPIVFDQRLRELSWGAWEGLTWEGINQRYPEAVQAWLADPVSVSPPGGEGMAQLGARVGPATEAICQAYPEGSVAIVAHGGTLQALLCQQIGLPLDRRWRLRLDPASLSELQVYAEGGILMRLNDRHHLDGLEPGKE